MTILTLASFKLLLCFTLVTILDLLNFIKKTSNCGSIHCYQTQQMQQHKMSYIRMSFLCKFNLNSVFIYVIPDTVCYGMCINVYPKLVLKFSAVQYFIASAANCIYKSTVVKKTVLYNFN